MKPLTLRCAQPVEVGIGRRARCLAGLLVGLLLLAQSLGLAHRVAHAPGLAAAELAHPHGHPHGHGHGHGHEHGHEHGHGPGLTAWFTRLGHQCDEHPGVVPESSRGFAHGLFDHEPGSEDCRLIDQLAHADVLRGCETALPARLAATGPVATGPVLALPRPAAAPYLARGPPAVAEGVFTRA